jgi:A49-like RNA polymerase I associated factor
MEIKQFHDSHIFSVAFPAIEPHKSISYKCYLRAGSRKEDNEDNEHEDFASQDSLIAGEGETVKYFTLDETKEAAVGCRFVFDGIIPKFTILQKFFYLDTSPRYLVAVYNRRTHKTVVRLAPLHIFAREVKSLKVAKPIQPTAQEWRAARTALGESFGTKKAQAATKAAERNKVDVAAMEGVIEHIVDSIEKNTEALPPQGTWHSLHAHLRPEMFIFMQMSLDQAHTDTDLYLHFILMQPIRQKFTTSLTLFLRHNGKPNPQRQRTVQNL